MTAGRETIANTDGFVLIMQNGVCSFWLVVLAILYKRANAISDRRTDLNDTASETRCGIETRVLPPPRCHYVKRNVSETNMIHKNCFQCITGSAPSELFFWQRQLNHFACHSKLQAVPTKLAASSG